MLKELTILSLFFEDPNIVYSARELAQKAGISHITMSKVLKNYSFIKREKNGPYLGFKAEITEDFVRLRKIYNLQKLEESGILKELSKFYDIPVIILFGSYANAQNVPKSDIDIVVISTHKKIFDTKKFEKKLKHKIQLFIFTQKEIESMKQDNPSLLNSICNGIVLQGELEVFT
jgi:predicted nucleotidyltransferase